ncbi:MAG: glycoside hydrolase family 127 protein [Candidatus Aminicenantes bacterium]|nr:glycoside hydrolase family 127 protein [Candidatus Aminicenantes bacterium]
MPLLMNIRASCIPAAAFILMTALPALGGAVRDYPLRPVDFTRYKITDAFWRPRLQTNREVTIPFALEKCRATGRLDNFLKAAGLLPGAYIGKRYNDSDVYKIVEGASYSLCLAPDPSLEREIDEVIAAIAAAQEKDGYLYTARTVDPAAPPPGAGPERWSLLESSHELYNAGHLYESAAAHYRATGKRSLLDVALKNADLIAEVFGPGKRRGFPGHQEIEIGLVKLFRLTGKRAYLDLAAFFLESRGTKPYRTMFPEDSPFAVYNRAEYVQAHKPLLEQREAVGHAVRAAYMYSGMADVAALTGDRRFRRAVERLWRDVVGKKTYLTGGIGARKEGEAFGDAFELPNAEAYGETCAAIGSVLWNHRLFLSRGKSEFMDIVEWTLYNGLLSGVSLSGDRFFYTNPLESDGRTGFNQGAAERQPWFEVACCPGNICRFLPSLPGYVLAQADDTVYVSLFIRGGAELEIRGRPVRLAVETDYPWQGRMKFAVDPRSPLDFEIALRIPGWALGRPLPGGLYAFADRTQEQPSLRVNGEPRPLRLRDGYARLRRLWRPGDVIELELPMTVRRVVARREVEAARGRVALTRGPLVYCFEAADNGGRVLGRAIPDGMIFEAQERPGLLGGVTVLVGCDPSGYGALTAVPYYAWSHRGPGEMAVWLSRGRQQSAAPRRAQTSAKAQRPL